MFALNVCKKLIALGLLQEGFLPHLPRYENFLEGVLSWGVTYEALSDLLLREYGISSRRVQDCEPSYEFVTALHPRIEQFIKKHLVMPVSRSENRLFLIMANPFDHVAADDIRVLTGCDIEKLFAEPQAVRRCIDGLFGEPPEAQRTGARTAQAVRLHTDVQDAPSVRLLNDMIEAAIRCSASDIHIEPFGERLRVRHRIDGELTLYREINAAEHPGLLARLKVISNLDTVEKRMPQDGHIIGGIYSDKVDFRVGTIPTVHGEKAVIRLIYSKHSKTDKHSLGFFPEDMPDIERMFNVGAGAVIVTGPTGSGKTTTLAAFLNELNAMNVNVVSIEDPVENDIHGVNQININPKIGMGFAEMLRAVLRQDPDIIMLGEIRDAETAAVAARAALTGHLLLTTLHTNDAVGCVTRLTDMGVPRYIVAAVLKGVISQRLMRRLCPHCKMSALVSRADAHALGLEPDAQVYHAVGCGRCNNTGYAGRLAVYEYILVDAELRGMIHDNAGAEEIRRRLDRQGMRRIWQNAARNVILGNSTVSEMYRAVYHEQ